MLTHHTAQDPRVVQVLKQTDRVSPTLDLFHSSSQHIMGCIITANQTANHRAASVRSHKKELAFFLRLSSYRSSDHLIPFLSVPGVKLHR